jgi:Fic-DOC domain mobile mystery protein B
VGIEFEYPVGATPLDPDEAAGLIPDHITNQGQLNRWELGNVLRGEEWAFSSKRTNLLSREFIVALHKHMFGDTWRWAGEFRKTEKNIGVAPEVIEVEIRKLCEDIEAQLKDKSWSIDEIAARFHHRLVCIHPFPNGNGRFARTMTDLLLVRHESERFSWGAGDLNSNTSEVRKRYISALQAADGKKYTELFAFVRDS